MNSGCMKSTILAALNVAQDTVNGRIWTSLKTRSLTESCWVQTLKVWVDWVIVAMPLCGSTS